MLPQNKLIDRLRHICREDDRLVAAMLYGSFARLEVDQYSDIDVILYFADDILNDIDQFDWLSQISSIDLIYTNEYGNTTVIFSNLVRGEFHFDPAGTMSQLSSHYGTQSYPSHETTILVDKSGRLTEFLQPLIGVPPRHISADQAAYLCKSFLNWQLFGMNVLARGEYARALEVMNLVHDNLLRMARLEEGKSERWITPTRFLERDISSATYEQFRHCTASLEPRELQSAYAHAWRWGKELIGRLAIRFDFLPPGDLIEKLNLRFEGSYQNGPNNS